MACNYTRVTYAELWYKIVQVVWSELIHLTRSSSFPNPSRDEHRGDIDLGRFRLSDSHRAVLRYRSSGGGLIRR
jgi:hypothetical protein